MYFVLNHVSFSVPTTTVFHVSLFLQHCLNSDEVICDQGTAEYSGISGYERVPQ
jgi:hypothetical protein